MKATQRNAAAVVFDLRAKGTQVPKGRKCARGDCPESEALLVGRVLQPRQAAGEPDAGFINVIGSVDRGDVDSPRVTGGDRPARGFDVERDLQGAREFVEGAQRNQADGDVE